MTTPHLPSWAEDVHDPRLCDQVIWRFNPDDGLLFIYDLVADHTGDHEGFEVYRGVTDRRLTWPSS